MTALVTLENVSMRFALESDSQHSVFNGVTLSLNAGERWDFWVATGVVNPPCCASWRGYMSPPRAALPGPGVSVSLLSLGLGFRWDLSGRDNALLSAC